MRWLRLIGLLLIAALLQGTFVPAIGVRGVRPDLLLLLALCVATREPPVRGSRWTAFWIGWAAGFLHDVCSVGSAMPFGVTALVFGLTTVAAARLGAELFLDSAVAQALVLAPVCLAAHLVLAGVLAGATGAPTGTLLGRAFWTAMYSGLVAPLVFAAVRPLERFLRIHPRRSLWGA